MIRACRRYLKPCNLTINDRVVNSQFLPTSLTVIRYDGAKLSYRFHHSWRDDNCHPYEMLIGNTDSV